MKDDDLTRQMHARWEQFYPFISSLAQNKSVPIGEAQPTNEHGIYLLFDEHGELSYIGKAIGSKGLRDRLISKHISGDDSHAVQRAYLSKYPDRMQRRHFIKTRIHAKWISLEDDNFIADLERLLIWLYRPAWNRQ